MLFFLNSIGIKHKISLNTFSKEQPGYWGFTYLGGSECLLPLNLSNFANKASFQTEARLIRGRKGYSSAETRCHGFLVFESRFRGFSVLVSRYRGFHSPEKSFWISMPWFNCLRSPMSWLFVTKSRYRGF